MDWFKGIFEVNYIFTPLIPFGIILAFINLDSGNMLIYILALCAVVIGFVGLFLKNIWTKLIAGFLFASTGSYIVLSLYNFYMVKFGLIAGILVVLFALLIIIGGFLTMYHAIVGEEPTEDEEYDGEYSEYYDDEYYEEEN